MVAQSIKMALKAIVANKTRSFLTMLGIIIGVFSLVVLVALVNGVLGYVTDSLSSFGNNYVEVSIMNDKGYPIEKEDLDEISNMTEINEVTPSLQFPGSTFVYKKTEKKGITYGVNSAYFRLENLKLSYGRPISVIDNENAVRVAVINNKLAQELYKTENTVGETIKINGINYDIIGVLAAKDGSFASMISEDNYEAYIPESCFTRQANYEFKGYDTFLASLNTDISIEEGKEVLEEYFYKRFDKDKDAFSVITMDELTSMMDNITIALSAVFGGIAAISLLVGGIGIMNIMLVSVTERTKEIGIRKAIGASTRSILLQFLIEAFVISLTGCIIGLIFSYIVVWLINQIVALLNFELHFSIPLYAVFISAGFSLLVGLIFGLYPANKAAKKKPIEALRYDG